MKHISNGRSSGINDADQPCFVAEGELTCCVADFLAMVVADTQFHAREAAKKVDAAEVNETIELVARARQETTVPLGAVIVNRVLPEEGVGKALRRYAEAQRTHLAEIDAIFAPLPILHVPAG